MECFFSEFKSLMFEGRMDKTAWQRPEFEANNPKFDKNIPKEENHVSVSVCVFLREFHKCGISVKLSVLRVREWI